jgi:hypothetical protein
MVHLHYPIIVGLPLLLILEWGVLVSMIIGQEDKTTTCDEEVVISKLMDEIVVTLGQRDNDRVPVGITYRVHENGLA